MTNTHWKDQRNLLGAVLRAWMEDARNSARHRGGVANVLGSFTSADPNHLAWCLGAKSVVDLADEGYWIVGRPIEVHGPTLTPVATVALKENAEQITCTIRVALLFETPRGIEAVGYRYESPESEGMPHSYPHAQSIGGWHQRQQCLLHPHNLGDDIRECIENRLAQLGVLVEDGDDRPLLIPTSEVRPAFPLRAGYTLPGLAATMLVSLYGAAEIQAMLEGVQRLQATESGIRDDVGLALA